jgi:hypothetical protein
MSGESAVMSCMHLREQCLSATDVDGDIRIQDPILSTDSRMHFRMHFLDKEVRADTSQVGGHADIRIASRRDAD